MSINWLKGLLSLNRRVAERHETPGLVAYYWDGGPPAAHAVRNISSTGLYLVTEERWYPGTLVKLTLQKVGSAGKGSEEIVILRAKAVRSGPDGVGFVFVLPKSQDSRQPRILTGLSDRKAFDRFLQSLGSMRTSEQDQGTSVKSTREGDAGFDGRA